MTARSRRRYHSFLERTTDGLREAVERIAYAQETATAPGLLQKLDPRIKTIALLVLVVAATLSATLAGILIVFFFALVLAACSRLSIRELASRVWVGALVFSGAIALPACVLTPGHAVFHIPALHWPVTAPGIRTAMYLVLRVETAATLGALLVFTTPWAHVLRALRSLRVPVVFVVILGMTYRYVLLLLESAHEMFESRRSRLVGRLGTADRRRLAVATAGALLGKTMHLGGEVYMAMQARGFRGEVHVLDRFRLHGRDWVAMVAVAAVTAVAVWAGR